MFLLHHLGAGIAGFNGSVLAAYPDKRVDPCVLHLQFHTQKTLLEFFEAHMSSTWGSKLDVYI